MTRFGRNISLHRLEIELEKLALGAWHFIGTLMNFGEVGGGEADGETSGLDGEGPVEDILSEIW